MMSDFDALSKHQLEVFEQVAVNNDTSHDPNVLGFLYAHGFLLRREEPFADGLGFVIRYDVPISVHAAWCAWCAMQEDEDE